MVEIFKNRHMIYESKLVNRAPSEMHDHSDTSKISQFFVAVKRADRHGIHLELSV